MRVERSGSVVRIDVDLEGGSTAAATVRFAAEYQATQFAEALLRDAAVAAEEEHHQLVREAEELRREVAALRASTLPARSQVKCDVDHLLFGLRPGDARPSVRRGRRSL